jgi:hypothetical protein
MESAKHLISQTDPLRQSLVSRSGQFLEGGLNPAASPLFAPTKVSFDQQFKRAREGIMSTGLTGGALKSAIGNLEAQKAGGLASAMGGISGQELQNALGLATGQLGTASNLLGQAGAAQAQQAQAQAAQKGAKGQAAGSAAALAMFA